MNPCRIESVPCPACQIPTELRRLLSTDGYVAIDLDYRVYTRGADPTRMLVARCPSCGFCEYVTDFRASISDSTKEFVRSAEYREMLGSDRASDFPLIARIKEIKGEVLLRIVYAYVRASWFSGDLGRFQEERLFLTKAADCFTRIIQGESQARGVNADWSATAERERSLYMLGEIHRRLGDFDKAQGFLNQIQGADFSGLVRDQKNLIGKKDTNRKRAKAR